MEWKIFYGDGSTFEHTQGSWGLAPVDNVQAILVQKQTPYGRHGYILRGKDYYCFDGVDFLKSNDTRDFPAGIIKYGRWISDAAFEDILRVAKDHLGF